MRIVYYPDPVLLKPAATLDQLPGNMEDIVIGMRKVMQLERGIGLAAPQVGLSLRMILVNATGEPEDEQWLVNPEIVGFHGKKIWGEEGCLSFPGIWGEVLRHSRIEVKYQDLDFQPQTLEAEDLTARILQHEIDHLAGQIFVNKMRPADKIRVKPELEELKARFQSDPPA